MSKNVKLIFAIIFAVMVGLLVFNFYKMAVNNTGIVAKFGVWPAAAICLATGATGVLIGFALVKALKIK